jgi:MOSC domain-containing protein YiiM
MKSEIDRPRVYRLSISPRKGEKKHNVNEVDVLADGGIAGDAHGLSARPISLLPFESFEKVKHPDLDISPGDFAENITTAGVDFARLQVGTRIKIGRSVQIEVIQIGKKCHHNCIIKETVGDCIMPREGVFGRILNGGKIALGDPIRVME